MIGSAIDIGAYEYAGTTNVFEYQLSSTISMYPNPTNGKFQLSIDSSTKKYDLEIYDAQGRTIYSTSYVATQPSFEIDLSNSPKGFYFIKLTSVSETSYLKMIIQ